MTAAEDLAQQPHEDAPPEGEAGNVTVPAWGSRPAFGGLPAYGLATLTGILYFLGFPGIDLWPLSLVALVPLLIAMRGQTTRRASGLGWMAGFTMNMLGFYWLTPMLQDFAGLPFVGALAGATLVCAYQGGRIALCGFLFARASSRGWPAAAMFAGAFAVSELLYPLLFPWYFGASVHNALPLLQTAELGGPILVGLVLVAPNVAVAHLIEWRSFGAKPSRTLLVIGAAVPLLAAAHGWLRIQQVHTAGTTTEALMLGERRIAATICYEDIIPSFFNDVVRATNPDLLLNITNDAWFLDTTEPWIHFALAKLRAVEHRRYLVRATNSGVSGIIDATGAVVTHGGTFVAENVVGEARYMAGGTIYRAIGDKPWWGLALVMSALSFVRRRPRAHIGRPPPPHGHTAPPTPAG